MRRHRAHNRLAPLKLPSWLCSVWRAVFAGARASERAAAILLSSRRHFLVASGARARFNAAARRHARACADAGATLALTGPWPAYNFVGTPEEES